MSKSEATLKLEKMIWKATRKQGTFGCFEVTIGWFGKERVDYMTYDTKGTWRCYEIKVSKSDFHSKAHNTFLGHFNYYVMTKELFEQVKDEIPDEIGVYTEMWCVKKARRQELKEDEQVLKDSMIRSLCRDVDKHRRFNDPLFIDSLNQRIRQETQAKEQYREKYYELQRGIQEKYGLRWNKE